MSMGFMRDLSEVMRRMRTCADHSLEPYDLGFSEQLVIMYLHACGCAKQEAVASYFAIDRGAIAKTVLKLEKKGLVQRTVNPQSRREKLLELTPAAYEVIEDMQKAFDEWNRTAFEGISADELQTAFSVLERIASNVSKKKG